MRITATMTISLPAAMLRQFEEVRNGENRTRYELVREALWHYFETRYAVVQPNRKELRLIAPGRATLARGECTTLREYLHGLYWAKEMPMRGEILEKLTRHLSAPITTECGVVYLMVELRKLMDRQGSGSQYPLLRLFCDWTVHTSIGRNRAAEAFLLEFDKAAASMKAGNGLPLAFLHSLSLSNLRKEMRKYLEANDLPGSTVGNQDEWDGFLELFSAVVADCPITYANPQFPFQHIRSLTLTKELPKHSYVLELLGPDPFKVWMNWRVELNHGSVENWPSYN